MIKCEVVFDGNLIYCNGLLIEKSCFDYAVSNDEDEVVLDVVNLEQAIKYCMEN